MEPKSVPHFNSFKLTFICVIYFLKRNNVNRIYCALHWTTTYSLMSNGLRYLNVMTIYVYHKLGIFVYTFSCTLNGLYGKTMLQSIFQVTVLALKMCMLYTDYTFKFILLEL